MLRLSVVVSVVDVSSDRYKYNDFSQYNTRDDDDILNTMATVYCAVFICPIAIP